MSSVKDITIDENIYLLTSEGVKKFFKGELVDFILEDTAIAVDYQRIITEPSYSNIYILDRQNGRVIIYGKNGQIVQQYFNQLFKDAINLAVDEKNNKVVVILSDGSIAQFSI